MGLETEYAIRFRPRTAADRPSDYHLYSRLAAALRRRMPTAEAGGDLTAGKPGLFLANGGAIWFEHARPFTPHGLVEGSTPECPSPRQLLICQRAQDRLLSELARHAAAV